MSDDLTAVSLFSGPGGLELGAARAGVRLTAAVESDPHAAGTVARNIPDLRDRIIAQDLRSVRPEQLREMAGPTDVLLASPPGGLSKAAYWRGSSSGLDESISLIDAFTAQLRSLRPRCFAYVTVPSLLYRQRSSDEVRARLVDGLESAGYAWHWQVLNAADFGVPQRRHRVVVLGSVRGLPLPAFPAPTHVAPDARSLTTEMLPSHVTAGEALDGLESEPEPDEVVAGRWGHLLPAIPAGGNYQHFAVEREGVPPVFRWRSRYWSFLLKLDPAQPSPTISAQPGPYVGPFHWDSRRLRVPELRRLFGFPDSYEFSGSRPSVQQQIGSAVPPPLGAAVVEALRRALIAECE